MMIPEVEHAAIQVMLEQKFRELAAGKSNQLPSAEETEGQVSAWKSGIDKLTNLLFAQAEKSVIEPLELLETTWVGRHVVSPLLVRAVFYGYYSWSRATSLLRSGIPLDESCLMKPEELIPWAEAQSRRSGISVILGTRNNGEELRPLLFRKTRLDDYLLGIFSTEFPGVLANQMGKLAMLQRTGKIGDCFLGRVYASQVKGSGTEADREEADHDLSIFATLPPSDKPSQANPHLIKARRWLQLSHEELNRELATLEAT